MGLHTDGHPEQDRYPHAVLCRDAGQPADLRQRVDDDPPDSPGHRPLELGVGLVVAVQADVPAGLAGPLQHGQLAAGAGIQPYPVVGQPAGHLGAQERLARVVDVGAAAQVRERIPESVAEGHGPGPEVGLIEHVYRGAVLRREVADADPAHLQRTRRVTADGLGPYLRQQYVDVIGRPEPGGDGRHTPVTRCVQGTRFMGRHDPCSVRWVYPGPEGGTQPGSGQLIFPGRAAWLRSVIPPPARPPGHYGPGRNAAQVRVSRPRELAPGTRRHARSAGPGRVRPRSGRRRTAAGPPRG